MGKFFKQFSTYHFSIFHLPKAGSPKAALLRMTENTFVILVHHFRHSRTQCGNLANPTSPLERTKLCEHSELQIRERVLKPIFNYLCIFDTYRILTLFCVINFLINLSYCFVSTENNSIKNRLKAF